MQVTAVNRGAQNISGIFLCCLPLLQIPRHRSVRIQCNRSFLSYDLCKKLTKKEFMFYTGVTQTVLEIIYSCIGRGEVCNKLKYEYRNPTPKTEQSYPDLTFKDKMLLTLLRLRRGLPLADLKIVFIISTTHASRVAYTWIRFLSLQLSQLQTCSHQHQPKMH